MGDYNNLVNLCRICLTSNNSMIDLYATNCKDLMLLYACVPESTVISYLRDRPGQICRKCLDNLKTTNDFQKQCLKSTRSIVAANERTSELKSDSQNTIEISDDEIDDESDNDLLRYDQFITNYSQDTASEQTSDTQNIEISDHATDTESITYQDGNNHSDSNRGTELESNNPEVIQINVDENCSVSVRDFPVLIFDSNRGTELASNNPEAIQISEDDENDSVCDFPEYISDSNRGTELASNNPEVIQINVDENCSVSVRDFPVLIFDSNRGTELASNNPEAIQISEDDENDSVCDFPEYISDSNRGTELASNNPEVIQINVDENCSVSVRDFPVLIFDSNRGTELASNNPEAIQISEDDENDSVCDFPEYISDSNRGTELASINPEVIHISDDDDDEKDSVCDFPEYVICINPKMNIETFRINNSHLNVSSFTNNVAEREKKEVIEISDDDDEHLNPIPIGEKNHQENKMGPKSTKKKSMTKDMSGSDSCVESDSEIPFTDQSFVRNRLKLIKAVLKLVRRKMLRKMAPAFMKDLSLTDIKAMLVEELLGISDKRLLNTMKGVNIDDLSSSSDESDDPDKEQTKTTDEQTEVISLDDITDESDDFVELTLSNRELLEIEGAASSTDKAAGKRKLNEPQKAKKKRKHKEKIKTDVDQVDGEQVTNILNLLELQARARAIRSQLAVEDCVKTEPELQSSAKTSEETKSDGESVVILSPVHTSVVIIASDSDMEDTTVTVKPEDDSKMPDVAPTVIETKLAETTDEKAIDGSFDESDINTTNETNVILQ